jgi:hypothetical protein
MATAGNSFHTSAVADRSTALSHAISVGYLASPDTEHPHMPLSGRSNNRIFLKSG